MLFYIAKTNKCTNPSKPTGDQRVQLRGPNTFNKQIQQNSTFKLIQLEVLKEKNSSTIPATTAATADEIAVTTLATTTTTATLNNCHS
jgi:hypothetical protein